MERRWKEDGKRRERRWKEESNSTIRCCNLPVICRLCKITYTGMLFFGEIYYADRTPVYASFTSINCSPDWVPKKAMAFFAALRN